MATDKTDKQVINRLSKRFPCIVKWGQHIGSYDYYIANQLLKAEKDNAPKTAYTHWDDAGWLDAENVVNIEVKNLLLS